MVWVRFRKDPHIDWTKIQSPSASSALEAQHNLESHGTMILDLCKEGA